MRSLTTIIAAAMLSIGIVSTASASDLLFTASEIAAIKAYYAREAADGARAGGRSGDSGNRTGVTGGRTGTTGGSADDSRGDVRSSGTVRVPSADAGRASSADWDHGGKHGKGKGRKGGRGALPPGIAKNLARGKPLPPGIAMQMLPDDLTVELPPPPPGCARIIVDGKVVLIDLATRVVHDILSDILYR